MLRKVKRQLRTRQPFMTPKQRQRLDQDIKELEAIELRSRGYHPVPRYMLVKNADGREYFVHRLFLYAGPCDEVEAVDGDFTNYATVTYTKTEAPVATDGLGVARGDRPAKNGKAPSVWSDQVTVPNLRITNSGVVQRKFDKEMLQIKTTLQRDIDTRLRIQPNADLASQAMYFGEIVETGDFKPLSPREMVAHGLHREPPTRGDRKKVIERRKMAEPKE